MTNSLYVHIPWCVKKCPYCDFNSHPQRGALPEQDYIDALMADLDQDLLLLSNHELQSIFIGGGTPSLFSAEELARFLEHAKTKLNFTSDIEITLEANPGTIERGRFQSYFDIGINRISLGVQSFSDTHLKTLGRIHSSDDAKHAVDEVHDAGFQTFNIDIMHGLPNQTTDEAMADLEQAMALSPTHLSWYQLTLEPNTLFYAKPPTLPHDDALFEIEEAGKKLIEAQGFGQYEISAYAKPGHESRHNLNYWQFGDYLGIGAGAHGKVTLADRILRTAKHRHPKDYLNPDKPFLSQERVLTQEELPLEFMMNALRLKGGVSVAVFESRTGLSIDVISKQLQTLRSQSLLVEDETQLQTTPQGARFLNEVLGAFTC